MSINQSNIGALRALSKALRREADHTRGVCDKATRALPQIERLRIAADVAEIFASACNEAAEDLNQQDLDAIERLKS